MTALVLHRWHIFFSGTVQGVGFRYTVYGIAQRLNVTGWVRNCRDGRVELVAEGSAAELETLLEKIQEAMSGYIDHIQKFQEAATGEFQNFQIGATF